MMQSLGRAIVAAVYPPQCVSCGGLTETPFGLCGPCWRDAHFIGGLVCDLCGAPLPGDSDAIAHCDDCLATPRPWARGRAVCLYRDRAREMVLALKHGDRSDLARSLGGWMVQAAGPLILPDMVVAPVPLHRWRLWRRRFNQAALLAQRVGAGAGLPVIPDALVRPRMTRPLEGHGREARFAALDGAIRPHPRRGGRLAGRPVLIVDDVMTSGATLAAASEAALAAGATEVRILVLARAAKAA